MIGTRSIGRRMRPLWALFALPATIAHEVTHALASVPWARQVAIVADPRSGRMTARVQWREGTGRYAVMFAALAPFVAGVLAALAALALWIAEGARIPSESVDIATWAILCAWWVIYMTPSISDEETATGGDE